MLPGLAVVGLFVFVGIAGPILAPYDPLLINPERRFEKPGRAHPLGLDELGRDVLSRLFAGARPSLMMGIVPAALGVAAAAITGYISSATKFLDEVSMMIVDILLAFPAVVLAVAIVAALGPGLTNTVVVLSLVAIPRFARVMRSSILSIKTNEYVEAARAFGATPIRIYFRHVLPNSVAPTLVLGSLQVGVGILQGAGLSFLGLGVQPPDAEWGAMIGSARAYVHQAPFLTIYPGLAIALVVLGINMLGDGLRDILDPTLRGLA